MSKYPTITLGGFITSDEVTELAALLAQSDRYPSIMSDEGSLAHEAPLDDEERESFYRDAINQSIQEGQPFRFGTGDPDWRTDRMGHTAESYLGYVTDPLWLWLEKRLHRLVRRSYTPGGFIIINGKPYLSVLLDDIGEAPILNLSLFFPHTENGKALRPDTATEILRKTLRAIRVFNFTPPPLMIPSGGSNINANLASSSFDLAWSLRNLMTGTLHGTYTRDELNSIESRARASAEAYSLLQTANNPLRLTLGGTE